MRRRPVFTVHIADTREFDFVPEPLADSRAPSLELRSRPLESMIGMPHLTRPHVLEDIVVFRVWRSYKHGIRLGKFEDCPLECWQAIEVDVPKEELMKRLTGRRSCPVCGEIYNIYSKPPKTGGGCDLHPEAQLLQRADDVEEKVRVRLETYEEQTKPLIDYYERSGRLKKVDGTGDVEDIYSNLEANL